MLAGQLEQEQVSVVARLLTLQRLLVSHILADVTVILQVCVSSGLNLGEHTKSLTSNSSRKCCELDFLTAIDNS